MELQNTEYIVTLKKENQRLRMAASSSDKDQEIKALKLSNQKLKNETMIKQQEISQLKFEIKMKGDDHQRQLQEKYKQG